MLNRFFRATFDFARCKASQSATWAVFVRDTVSGFITTAHHTVMVLGILAIATLGLMFVKPEITDQIKELSPFAQAEGEEDEELPPLAALTEAPVQAAEQEVVKDSPAANSRPQQWVTKWLAKRYRVATDATDMLVSAAYKTAKEIKLDPLLILSVMAIESRFNPIAESPLGAQGLMQVMSKVHRDKFEDHGGVKAALNPVANIKVGSLILKDYVTRGGSIEAGLKLYVGAGAFESDAGYGTRVMAEYHRLKDVSMGKKVPIYATSASASVQKAPQAASASPTQPLASADRLAPL